MHVNGAVTIQNGQVTNDMLQGSIAYAKLDLNNAVTDGDLVGSIQYSKLSLSNAIQNGDLAGSIANDKISALNGVTAGTAVADKAVVVDSSKDIAGINEPEVTTLAFAGNQWRMKISSGSIVMEWNNAGTWEVKHTFASS